MNTKNKKKDKTKPFERKKVVKNKDRADKKTVEANEETTGQIGVLRVCNFNGQCVLF